MRSRTRPVLQACLAIALAAEVVALSTNDVTITEMGRELLGTLPKKIGAAWVFWHLVFEEDAKRRWGVRP